MEHIFHEKQEGNLCAQHCLNALLQRNHFDAVMLAEIAAQLDEEERKRMAESGEDTAEYREFMNRPSENVNNTGYFSVQVISSALATLNLELLSFNNPRAEQARIDPTSMRAYICHQNNHWFTIRKIGNQWFDLNSLFKTPKLLSDLHVSEFLTQLTAEGYMIFIVIGDLPISESDRKLSTRRITFEEAEDFAIKNRGTGKTRKTKKEKKFRLWGGQGSRLGNAAESPDEEDDKDLQKALRLSVAETKINHVGQNTSQIDGPASSASAQSGSLTAEEIRQKRLARFHNQSSE